MSSAQASVDESRQHLLPEWVAQDGVMLTWPRPGSEWDRFMPAAGKSFAAIAAAISRRERVLICSAGPEQEAQIRERIRESGGDNARLLFGHAPADDTWARDHGPITVSCGGKLRLLNFRFNGWGKKYPHARDAGIARALHRQGVFGATPMDFIEFVLEGGSIETDGRGTLLTTESCLLNPNRNPGLDRAQIETILADNLGLTHFLWLSHGDLEGDDTDGHIDTLARFADADTIVYQSCADPLDPHHEPLTQMAAELAAFRNPEGKPYRLVPLPLPAPQYSTGGDRLPAGYANFLIINGAVLMPAYGDPADAVAQAALAPCFPDREVVPVDCRALIEQYGSLHCVTMQLPRGTL